MYGAGFCTFQTASIEMKWVLMRFGTVEAADTLINADSKKRRSFIVPLIVAGHGQRQAQK